MTISLDLDHDLLQADGVESVTLFRRGAPTDAEGATIPALRRVVSTREAAASAGRYTTSDVNWHVPSRALEEAPRLGDILRDAAGRRWTVLETAAIVLGSRWRCATRSLAIVFGLDEQIAVLKATYAQQSDGIAEPQWRPWKSGLRARIQPVTTTVTSEHLARQTIARCQVFLEENLALDETHRIQAADGAVYKILAVNGAERIDQLQVLDVEATPWP
jgi:hypothetical protein